MTRKEAIDAIAATLPKLSDERVQLLAAITRDWSAEARPAEDAETLAAIAEGMAQARRGEFATDTEVAEAYARFRK